MALDRLDEAIALTLGFDEDVTCPYAAKIGGIFLRACCYADQGKNEQAFTDFAKVASSEGDLDQRAYAKHRMTVSLLRLNRGGAPKNVLDALHETVRFVEDKREALSSRTVADILGSSFLALGQLLHAVRSDGDAIGFLRQGIAEGSEGIKLRAANELLDLVTVDGEQREILESACKPLVNRDGGTGGGTTFAGVDRPIIVRLGAWASLLKMQKQYDALLDYAVRSGMVANDSLSALKLDIWEAQRETSSADVSVLRDIIDNRESIADETAARALAYKIHRRSDRN